MAGLIKEKLLDYALNRLSLDERSDLTIAIQNVLLLRKDAEYLNLYLSGYSAKEIAAMYISTTHEVEIVLSRIFLAIETASGYTDEGFIHKVESEPKHRRSGIIVLKEFLKEHGTQFMTHEIE